MIYLRDHRVVDGVGIDVEVVYCLVEVDSIWESMILSNVGEVMYSRKHRGQISLTFRDDSMS